MIKKILVLSYYHPFIAGGGHRPAQFLIQDLLLYRKIAFVFTSRTGIENIPNFTTSELYDHLRVYWYAKNKLFRISGGKILQNDSIDTETFLETWNPTYARAHNPVEAFIPFLHSMKTLGIPFIYDQMDYWADFVVQPWGAIEVEAKYIYLSNAIVTVSQFLMERLPFDKTNCLIPNAINPDFLERLEHTKSQNHLLKSYTPDILYMGAMWPNWFDWDLLDYIVKARPYYHFTLVGAWRASSDENDGKNVKAIIQTLKERRNVELIDEVTHDELIPWLLRANVGIIPFVVNNITIACSPLKVFEYLGASLRVVSTMVPEIKDYPLTKISETYDAFLAELDSAATTKLTADDVERVRSFCRQNTWESRLILLDNVVKGILK